VVVIRSFVRASSGKGAKGCATFCAAFVDVDVAPEQQSCKNFVFPLCCFPSLLEGNRRITKLSTKVIREERRIRREEEEEEDEERNWVEQKTVVEQKEGLLFPLYLLILGPHNNARFRLPISLPRLETSASTNFDPQRISQHRRESNYAIEANGSRGKWRSMRNRARSNGALVLFRWKQKGGKAKKNRHRNRRKSTTELPFFLAVCNDHSTIFRPADSKTPSKTLRAYLL